MNKHVFSPLKKSGECRYTLPTTYSSGMRVPGVIYAEGELLSVLEGDSALEQLANVAHLPGIVGASFAMPGIHPGYGFPIGGVAATSMKDGVISPGGVGYDINCGVRILVTDLDADRVRSDIRRLTDAIFGAVPSGVGVAGPIDLSIEQMKKVLEEGAEWAVKNGYGEARDLEFSEENGKMAAANTDRISKRALTRGLKQLGTLGSGNHFVEIDEVTQTFDERAARAFGLHKGSVVIQIHTGSRGFGHQVCTDHLRIMAKAVKRYGIELPDRQLACAPVRSAEGERYFAEMAAAANYAWANRQVISHYVRSALRDTFGKVETPLLYDVCHNIAKVERHSVYDERTGGTTDDVELCVHRKGATRAFGPGHKDIPKAYESVGQPVFVPGDMGRCSYVLAGTEAAMRLSFGSCCHGAGRVMSRSGAKRSISGKSVAQDLLDRGIYVRATSPRTLAEEASEAYKDVSLVVDIAERAGLGRKVARLEPLGVIKG